MQYYVVVHKASLDAALCSLCARRLLMTQHFEVAELRRRKAERLTHLIMYTCLYNIM
jgi:hypothetical protein